KANETARAKIFFDEKQNGLRREWHGRVFVNPPYGKVGTESMASAFCHKAIDEMDAGRVKECIILVNSLHSQQWQMPLYEFPVCFVDHRIQFLDETGEKNKNPTFQNIFVYMGDNEQKFAEVFSRFGYVMKRISGHPL